MSLPEDNPTVIVEEDEWKPVPLRRQTSKRASVKATRNILSEVLKEVEDEKKTQNTTTKSDKKKQNTQQMKRQMTDALNKVKDLVKDPTPIIDMLNETVEKNKEKLGKAVDTIETTYSEKVLQIVSKDDTKVTLKKRKSKRNNKKTTTTTTTDNSAAPATSENPNSLVGEKRASSISSDSEEEVETAKPLFYPHSFVGQPSNLDVTLNDRVSNGADLFSLLKFKEFEGLYHLAFIYLTYSLIILIYNNIQERGLLFNFSFFTCSDTWRGIGLTGLLLLGNVMYSYLFFLLQYCYNHFNINTTIYFNTYALLQVIDVLAMTILILQARLTPFIAATAMMLAVCIILKQHSFIFTNYAFNANNKEQSMVEIPLRKSHYLYFLLCPTLVYELTYPKTEKIRISYIAKMTIQAVVCFLICYFILCQFITPYLSDLTLNPIMRILCAAIPAFCVWLFGFYMLFHCVLNILAELLMFADREFYTDWWNTTDIAAFWRTWNQPIHVWCLRHVYVETQVYANLDKKKASLATFVFSGIMHELVMCVMFRCCTPFFLMGMAVQFPMILVSSKIENKVIGNILMWLSLFFGQPLLEASYANIWFSTHNSWFCGPV